MMAAEKLSTIAGDIERLGRQQQAELMQQQVAHLQEEVNRCVEYLPHVLALATKKLASQHAAAEKG